MNQYIHTVLGGKAFGDGSLGSSTLSSSGTQSQTKGTAAGTSGTQALTTSVTSFANGDVVLIMQMQGTNYGKWEINRVLSGGGSTSLTMVSSLGTTYSSSGSNRAQIIKIPMYLDYTINSGVTLSGPAWDGSTGGLVVLAVRRTLTVNGTINVAGNAGSTGQGLTAGGVGIGFRGGNADSVNTDASSQGSAGESSSGANFPNYTVNADGQGGGGGRHSGNPGGASGGGGGNGTSGYAGNNEGGSNNQGGLGGGTAGTANLSEFVLGGGGGGASKEAVNTIGSGGAGAGGIIIFAREVIINNSTGSFNLTGGAGGSAFVGGGGGSGGSCLIKCQTASIGTNRINASGGLGSSSGTAGDGGSGRVAIHYSLSYSGSSTPTLNATLDTKLREIAAGSQIIQ